MVSQHDYQLPVVTHTVIKSWNNSIKQQEAALAQQRLNKMDALNTVNNLHLGVSIMEGVSFLDLFQKCVPTNTQNTEVSFITYLDPEKLIEWIGLRYQLNDDQLVAFHIIAQSFIQRHF